MRRLSPRLLSLLLVAAAVAGCGEGITEPARSPVAQRRLLRGAELAAVQMLQCPSANADAGLDALGVVNWWGGSVDGDVARVQVPIAAVDETTGITVAQPASSLMEVEFHANGEEHFEFDRPITVSIDYSRCPATAIASHAALRVIYIDALTKEPLEDMGGVVDSVARTITFQTGHFSSYAVAD